MIPLHCLPKTLNRSPSTGRYVRSPAGAEGLPNGSCATRVHEVGRFQVERTFAVMRGL